MLSSWRWSATSAAVALLACGAWGLRDSFDVDLEDFEKRQFTLDVSGRMVQVTNTKPPGGQVLKRQNSEGALDGPGRHSHRQPLRSLHSVSDTVDLKTSQAQEIKTELIHEVYVGETTLPIRDMHLFKAGDGVEVISNGHVHLTTITTKTGLVIIKDRFTQKFPKGSVVRKVDASYVEETKAAQAKAKEEDVVVKRKPLATASGGTSEPKVIKFRAKYDFLPDNKEFKAGMLYFKAGDVIDITWVPGEDWMMGRTQNNIEGLVPMNFVERMDKEKKTQEKRITDITVKGTRFEVGKGVYIFRAPTDTKESALNGKKCKLTRIFSAEEFGIQMLEGGASFNAGKLYKEIRPEWLVDEAAETVMKTKEREVVKPPTVMNARETEIKGRKIRREYIINAPAEEKEARLNGAKCTMEVIFKSSGLCGIKLLEGAGEEKAGSQLKINPEWLVEVQDSSEDSGGATGGMPGSSDEEGDKVRSKPPHVVVPVGGGGRGGGGQPPHRGGALSRQDSLTPTPLTVRAVTFNAGNQLVIQDEHWKGMITAATEDIRDVDMVIFGFQEIKDPDHLIEKMGKELLWKDDLTSRLEELLEAIAEAIRMPEDVKRSKDAAMEYLNGKDDQFDITTFMAKIEPVIAWAEQVQQQLKRIVFEQYPNFFSAIPARALERLFSMVQTLGTQAQAMKDIDLKASSKGSKVPTRQGTLKKVRDIQLKVSGPVDRAKGSHTPVSRQASRDDTSSVVKDIFSVDSESILRDFKTECGVLQVQAVSQQWHSNPLVCHKFKHYDTMMVVFVNPFSAWRIIADTKPTDTCKRTDDDGSEGCNIDNNKGFRKECGRVVNLLRLKVSKGVDVHYFGALNTHMSLSAETSERAKCVEAAVREAQDAECDALVFVGDFNSRLHCHRRLQLDDVEPLMSAAGWSKNWQANSLQTVLSTLSTNGNTPDSGQYRLTAGSSRLADEMNQLLDKKHEQVKCFEGKQVKEFHNNVSSLGLLEGDLDFNPTYRLGTEEFAQEETRKKKGTGFYQPVEGMKKCYYNPSGEPKNNPAWPDRVLRWSKEAGDKVTQAIVTELTEDAKATSIVLPIPDDHKPSFRRGAKVKVTCPDGNVHSTTVSGNTGVIVLNDPFAQNFPKGSKVNAEVLLYKSVETQVKEYKSVETTIGSDHAPVIATVGHVFRTLPSSRARPLPDKPV